MPTIRTCGRTVQPNRLHSTSSTAVKGRPSPLGWTSDDHQTCARLPGGGRLRGKAAGFAAVLGHHPCGVGKTQCGQIHLLGERPLHGDDMGGLQPRCAAGLQRGIHGQHPGVYPLGKIGDAAIRRPVPYCRWSAGYCPAYSPEMRRPPPHSPRRPHPPSVRRIARSRRRYSVSVSRQAVQMLSVMEVA